MQTDTISRQTRTTTSPTTEQIKPPDTPAATRGNGQQHLAVGQPAPGNVRKPVTYKQALNRNRVKRGYFSTKKENAVRVDFTEFGGEAEKAKEHFGNCLERIVYPLNYKKNTKRPVY